MSSPGRDHREHTLIPIDRHIEKNRTWRFQHMFDPRLNVGRMIDLKGRKSESLGKLDEIWPAGEIAF